MAKKKIYLASDHGGFSYKQRVMKFLLKLAYEVVDLGPYKFKNNDDYPDYVIPLAKKVAKDKKSLGIVFCRNGQGVCIATNKVKGVRAVTVFTKKMAMSTKRDDNANILCVPSDYMALLKVKSIVKVWIGTEFSKEARHKRRLKKVEKATKR